MKTILSLISLLALTLALNSKDNPKYTSADYKVLRACQARVYHSKQNNYNYDACDEMLKHKKAMRKYGAESSYHYWLDKFDR